jgi:signal transduction histidine kinase
VPILAPDGTPLHLLGISEDITARKAAEEELRAARDNLEAANKELESFSYSVAHDLRAPLRAIDGFSAALLEDHAASLDATGKDYLQRISKGARRMGELIDDLLQLSRIMRAETRMQDVDLTAMGTAVANDLRERHPKGEVRVQEGLVAHADPGFLRVALENLLDNALKFSSKNAAPVVELGTKRTDGGDDVFFVKDNGVGFDVQAARNLFGAFQRFHKPTEFGGTGIGLATVQRVVRRHGGRIWAESEPGRGTTFFFTLTAEARN